MDTNLAPGEQIAGYRIESFLAEGGMAVVYRARHIRLDRRVALKLLAPQLTEKESFRRRFMRESQLAASIDHPNIIPIFEASKIGEVLYIAMRYVDGPDLGELLEREGPLTLERAMGLFQQAASALDEAHEHGLVHRDVKPGNMLLVPGGRADGTDHVYLTDFGLTKRSDSLTGLTTTGEFLGTLPYVAPEQINGGHVDGRADVYALGCVLFRALTGVVPFDRDSNVAVMYAHLSQAPPAVTSLRPELPAEIDEVVQRAMAKRPEDRYPTCCDFITDLRAAAGGKRPASVAGEPNASPLSEAAPTSRASESREVDGARTGRRIRRVTAVMTLLSVALAGGALAAWRYGTSAHRDPAPVVLPFAVETYPGGLSVSRTWTLSGGRGDHLHGELRVDASKGTLPTLYEVLPTEMTSSLVNVTGPDLRVPAKSAIGYKLTSRTRSWTLTYDVPVRSAAPSLDRLRQWAQDWLREGTAFRRTLSLAEQPRVVTSIQFDRPSLPLSAAGRTGRLRVIAHYAGQGTYDVNRAAYVVDDPSVVTLAVNGQVTPRSPGLAHVIAVLGPLSTDEARIPVS